jgi:uncharacterized protein (DUF362 family)
MGEALARQDMCSPALSAWTGSRRGFLRLVVGLGLGPLLGACAHVEPSAPRPEVEPAAGLEPAYTPDPAVQPTMGSESSPSPHSTARPMVQAQLSATMTRSATVFASPPLAIPSTKEVIRKMSQVVLIRTSDREEGVRRALALLGVNGPGGREVLLKPNYNSADPTPGSTHSDVLRTLVTWLRARAAGSIIVADRSGMGQTRRVLEQTGVFALSQQLGFEIQVLDELEADGWQMVQPNGSHWREGFPIARLAQEMPYVVQTCCLKTHRYGGHFTLSLKNSVGLVAKAVPGRSTDYMKELHSSPHQRLMIAEINAAYTPDLVVLDGVEAFVRGGPDRGEHVQANAILASRDRVALDAVGVAILRHFGTTPEVGRGKIFDQEQIARAAELGLGAGGPEDIEIITDDQAGEDFAEQIQDILSA